MQAKSIGETRTLIVHPALNRQGARRSDAAQLDEICGLARAINLRVIASEIVRVTRIAPATFLSGGVCDRLADISDVELLIVNTKLSPTQQRNLERRLKLKVLDRTGLILEIFGARARTGEGRLQVTLANLTYQNSRLVRSWTHLERQRGGVGFVGGPGETQIEADRRMIATRIARVEKRLEAVRKRRALQRKARTRAPHPVVALVGYTNAGKSTLFNRLTQANIVAADMLFATLDPTMRGLDLPSGGRVIVSDTVGFISDLPTQLVAAFRATLEEVLSASLVLHIRDISHNDTQAQKHDVAETLETLGLDANVPIIEVLNKCDLLTATQRGREEARAQRGDVPFVFASAETGQGIDAVCESIEEIMRRDYGVFSYELSAAAGDALAWLYKRGAVAETEVLESGATRVTARLSPRDHGRFAKRFKII